MFFTPALLLILSTIDAAFATVPRMLCNRVVVVLHRDLKHTHSGQ
jgi:hypothetical protein